MKRLKALFVAATLFVAALVATAVGSGPASADQGVNVPCASTTTVNYFDGWGGYGTDVNGGATWEGSSANIRVESGRICDNGPATPFNTGWVLIGATNGSGWAQVGFIRLHGETSTYHFYEYTQDARSLVFDKLVGDGAVANGETHHYFVQYSPSKGEEEMDIDVTNVGNTSFNPFGVGWPVPLAMEWSTEGIYQGTDMPAYVAAPVLFSNMQTQAYNYQFYNTTPGLGPLLPNQSRFYHGPVSNRSFSVYTAS